MTFSSFIMRVALGASFISLVACGGNDDAGLDDIPLEPDLATGGHDEGRARSGERWVLDVVATNRGGVDARDFEVSASVRESFGHFMVHDGLRAGEAMLIHIPMSSLTANPGRYRGDFFVDRPDDVREFNEGNNSHHFHVLVSRGEDDGDGGGVRANLVTAPEAPGISGDFEIEVLSLPSGIK